MLIIWQSLRYSWLLFLFDYIHGMITDTCFRLMTSDQHRYYYKYRDIVIMKSRNSLFWLHYIDTNTKERISLLGIIEPVVRMLLRCSYWRRIELPSTWNWHYCCVLFSYNVTMLQCYHGILPFLQPYKLTRPKCQNCKRMVFKGFNVLILHIQLFYIYNDLKCWFSFQNWIIVFAFK